MAKLFAKRLTYWLTGTPDDSPPTVPVPPQITPLRDHVAFFLNLRGRLPPEMTREDIMDSINSAVTDRELQAHVMAYLRDYHGMTFDPKLNPNAPSPQYYSSTSRRLQLAGMVITGKTADAGVSKSHALKPYFTSVPVGFDTPAEAPPTPTKKVKGAPAGDTVKTKSKKEAKAGGTGTAGSKKEAPTAKTVTAGGKEASATKTVIAGGEKEEPAGEMLTTGDYETTTTATVTDAGGKDTPSMTPAPAQTAEKTTAEEKKLNETSTKS